MSTYKGQAISIDSQLQNLIEKGLTIDNYEYAHNWLTNVSSYRLKKYTYTFKDDDSLNFTTGTSFEQIIDLYLFDRKLKLILFDAIETIEVSVKSLISHLMSLKHGTHWYLDSSHFSDTFEYNKFIDKIKDEFLEQEEPGVQRYRKFISEPELPPSWMMIEFITLGTVSKMFEYLTSRQEKQEICKIFNLPENIFISWLHSFTHQRNRCAHHQRIVYRTIKHDILLPSRIKHSFLKDTDSISRSSLYCSILCMIHLIKKINPESKFRQSLLSLIKESPQINFSKMGFIDNWEFEPIWHT